MKTLEERLAIVEKQNRITNEQIYLLVEDIETVREMIQLITKLITLKGEKKV